jgi:hypothetical protein
MPPINLTRFHGYLDDEPRSFPGVVILDRSILQALDLTFERTLSMRFEPHAHPYVQQLVARLVRGSIPRLQGADTEYQGGGPGGPRPVLHAETFVSRYDPTGPVEKPYPVEELEFGSRGAYSVYNWELFFHVPLTIAIHLSRSQRFAEAQRWFHYVFDPTADGEGPAPARFWGVRPFQTSDVVMIEEILVNLATGEDPKLRQETIDSIGAWMDDPFRPHLVARYRPSAYMLKTVMAYLDNLIAWGDSLFRQDTRESINEATQLYVLAANLLGPRPQPVPSKGDASPRTYAQLRGQLDAFGNALSELEAEIPLDTAPRPLRRRLTTRDEERTRLDALRSVGLYFCVPRNDQLVGYWDTVADRLFKIRNSLDIEGRFRQLPLFEPPIDPGLLARAVAAGVDVGAVVSGMSQPLPLVRFWVLVRQAAEICQEVKSLGTSLLAAMEKEDAEALAILRARHERVILELMESVRYAQWHEAIKNREGVERSIDAARERHAHYLRLLGAVDVGIPELDPLDVDSLMEMRFRSEEPGVVGVPAPITFAEMDPDHERRVLSQYEGDELAKLQEARGNEWSAEMQDRIGMAMSLIPDFGLQFEPLGMGLSVSFGGSNLAEMMTFTASFDRAKAAARTYEAGMAARIGSYERREQEWALQSNVAAREISQLYKQLRASQIREAITKREWDDHKRQIEHAERIEEFLTNEKDGKKTNQAFYAWMKREVRGLYAQCFQLAFDAAKKAERALGHELGDPEASYLSLGYTAGNEGLLAGEKLYLDIKRMELAYHELNRREYEITKHVSLRQLDPRALMSLRQTGRCEVELPEALFDLDGPGHYFRRIRTVSVTVPAVTGPYTSVACTLTLLKSSIRRSPLLRDGEYARAGDEDERFSDNWSSVQSVVTSGGERDSGLFEPSLRDERYLPFEGAGVVSKWRIELPTPVRQFDYETITDVVLHILYTAREAGGLLRDAAVVHLEEQIAAASTVGSVQLLSVRHDFPLAWARFQAATGVSSSAPAELQLELREEHYPFWSRGRREALHAIELFASRGGPAVEVIYPEDGRENTTSLQPDPTLDGLRVGALTPGDSSDPMPPPLGEFSLRLSDNTMDDLWLAVAWGGET